MNAEPKEVVSVVVLADGYELVRCAKLMTVFVGRRGRFIRHEGKRLRLNDENEAIINMRKPRNGQMSN